MVFLQDTSNLAGLKYPYLHAEAHAIVRATDPVGADLFVVRLGRRGNLACSRPCVNCLDLIQRAKINRVAYIDEEGQWNVMSVQS